MTKEKTEYKEVRIIELINSEPQKIEELIMTQNELDNVRDTHKIRKHIMGASKERIEEAEKKKEEKTKAKVGKLANVLRKYDTDVIKKAVREVIPDEEATDFNRTGCYDVDNEKTE